MYILLKDVIRIQLKKITLFFELKKFFGIDYVLGNRIPGNDPVT